MATKNVRKVKPDCCTAILSGGIEVDLEGDPNAYGGLRRLLDATPGSIGWDSNPYCVDDGKGTQVYELPMADGGKLEVPRKNLLALRWPGEAVEFDSPLDAPEVN